MTHVGGSLGGYQILAEISRGGMATVFRARRDGREVALKVVHPHLSRDASFVRMFIAEALLARRLQHPHIVRVDEFGEDGDAYYLVMEYVRGCSLARLQQVLAARGRRLPVAVAVWLASQVAEGLHAVHEVRGDRGEPLGAVHRDVSPHNILIDAGGTARLADFGISKLSSGSPATSTGFIKGKLRYMPPEQAYGRAVDRRTDIHALGIVLWELLAGRPLFEAADEIALLELVRHPRVEPPGRFVPDIAPALDEAVSAALAPEPDQRPRDALAFRDRLLAAMPAATALPDDIADLVREALADAEAPQAAPTALTIPSLPRRQRRRWLVAGALAAVALGTAARLALRRHDARPIAVAIYQDRPWAVAVDRDTVYWTNQALPRDTEGTIARAPKDGRVPANARPSAEGAGFQVIATGRALPGDIAVDEAYLYWTERHGGTVLRVAKHRRAGEGPEVLAAGQAEPLGIAVDGDAVYYSDARAGIVARIDKRAAGAAPVVLASGQRQPWVLALDRDHVYWIQRQAGLLMRARKDGSRPAVAVTPVSGDAWGLAVDESSVYWRDAGRDGAGRLMKCGKDGSRPSVLHARAGGEPFFLALDDEHVYWTSSDGAIVRCRKDGVRCDELARSQIVPHGIAVDRDHVFWTNYGGSAVMKMAKPGG